LLPIHREELVPAYRVVAGKTALMRTKPRLTALKLYVTEAFETRAVHEAVLLKMLLVLEEANPLLM
jgi:hypothetical protein